MSTPNLLMHELQALTAGEARRLWRQQIKERDGHKCVYCGSTENLTIDHVIPKFRGGPTTSSNCVTACRSCNQAKGTEHLDVFLQLRTA